MPKSKSDKNLIKIQKNKLKDLKNLLKKQKNLLSYQEKIISKTINDNNYNDNNNYDDNVTTEEEDYEEKKNSNLKSILKKPKVKFSQKIDYQNYNDYYKKKIDYDDNTNKKHKKYSSVSSSSSSSSSSLSEKEEEEEEEKYPEYDDDKYEKHFELYKKNSLSSSSSSSSTSSLLSSSSSLSENVVDNNDNNNKFKQNENDNNKGKIYKVWLTKNVDDKHSNDQEYLKKFGIVDIVNKKSPSAAAKNAVRVFEQRKNINLNKPISIMIIVYNTKLNRGIAYKIWRTTINLPGNFLPTHVLKTQKIFQINNILLKDCLDWKWNPSYIKQPLKNRMLDYKLVKIKKKN